MNKVVEGCRLEQRNTEILLAQIAAGDVYSRKKAEVERDLKIKAHLEAWGQSYKLEDLFKYFEVLNNIWERK